MTQFITREWRRHKTPFDALELLKKKYDSNCRKNYKSTTSTAHNEGSRHQRATVKRALRKYKARLLRSNQMDGSMPRLWTIGGRGAERRMEAERMKGRGRRLMAAAVLSLQETEEWKTKRDYRQFKQGCAHTRLLIEKRISPLDYDDIKRWNAPSDSKSSLFLPLNCQVARCPDWSSLSELRPKTNYITVILKKERKRWSHGRLHQRKHVSYTHTHT